ncbi:MAG: C/D box methylation guide ribonucleoprotein complex aNOP56 subunit [Nanoarchaeota archaeon]|nr:C/D box methylation guide ribonucleoprotein complex aNOP56 subunit [Nanoarchaeota archaeon]
MKAFVASCIVGVFAFNEDGELIDKVLFPKKVEEVAERLSKIKEGDLVKEEHKLVKALSMAGYDEIVWSKHSDVSGVNTVFQKSNLGDDKLQSEFRGYAIKFKWANTQAEINEILTKVNIALTKTKLREVKKDKIIMQAISSLDELDRTINIFSEHMREWYGLHFPEMSRLVSTNEKYAEIITANGKKFNIPDKNLNKTAEKSGGMDFSDEDIKTIRAYSKSILDMFKLKEEVTKYIENETKNEMPNISAIAGPLLAARLLQYAGGLEKMAKMPASTIQLLGAEKALFRHLRGEGKAPKFGVIFGHPYIQRADKDKKGKIARLIASKLSLASRFDFFSKTDKSADLKKELEEQVEKTLK